MNTGAQLSGRPAWVRGLATVSAAKTGPARVRRLTTGVGHRSPTTPGQRISPHGSSRLQLRSQGDPCCLSPTRPAWARHAADSPSTRCATQTRCVTCCPVENRHAHFGFELAYRMQTSVPDVMDISSRRDGTSVRHRRARLFATAPARAATGGTRALRSIVSSRLTSRGRGRQPCFRPQTLPRNRSTHRRTDAKTWERGLLNKHLSSGAAESGRTPMCRAA